MVVFHIKTGELYFCRW